MDWLIDAFEPTFMQRALIGGLVAVVATSLVGTWVVLRGLAFLGDALAHGVIPGIALAVLWGFSPIIGAFVAALVMSGFVSLVSNRTDVREDTAIGLLFVGMLSLGIVIVSRARSFSTEVTALLFGDVLGVTRSDINKSTGKAGRSHVGGPQQRGVIQSPQLLANRRCDGRVAVPMNVDPQRRDSI